MKIFEYLLGSARLMLKECIVIIFFYAKMTHSVFRIFSISTHFLNNMFAFDIFVHVCFEQVDFEIETDLIDISWKTFWKQTFFFS